MSSERSTYASFGEKVTVLGLSWRAVDFDKGIIRIEQQLFRAANRLQLAPLTKMPGS